MADVVAAGPYFTLFGVLAVVCAAMYYRTLSLAPPASATPEFKGFQRTFLSVFLIMMMADWLQGPYVYALYDSYGFSKGQIGQLFIVGFGSSMVFGTVVGGLADKYGRRLNCLLFAVLYGISCATKHFNNFEILMVGRLLGGVSTSILFSAFETWMIHEHRGSGYADDLMSATFSNMTFGSSMVAIIAGLLASALAAQFGPVAPFDASMLLLVIGGLIIAALWKENYGDSTRISTGFDNFGRAWSLLISSPRMILLGLIQSCFESAMYIFVFMWTPALEASLKIQWDAAMASVSPLPGLASPPTLPHGLVFAIFMVCCMIGSKLFEGFIATRPVENFARWVFVVSAIALAVPIVTSNHLLQIGAFCVFEVCCGVYFPSVGTMRSKYIPEEVRSTVMNVFRIGLNLVVVLTLVNIDTLAQDTVFMFTVVLLAIAVFCQHRLFALSQENQPQDVRARDGFDIGEEIDEATGKPPQRAHDLSE